MDNKKGLIFSVDDELRASVLTDIDEMMIDLHREGSYFQDQNVSADHLFYHWVRTVIARRWNKRYFPVSSVPSIELEQTMNHYLSNDEDKLVSRIPANAVIPNNFVLDQIDRTSLLIRGD